MVAHEIIMSALGLVFAIARARARPRSLTTMFMKLTKKVYIIFQNIIQIFASEGKYKT